MTSYGGPGRRVVIPQFGERPPEVIRDLLRIEEQAPPDPRELGPKDVIIAVKSAAVGWVDLLMSCGLYQHVASPPYCPGLEYAGEVAWVGEQVERVRVGDRVIGDGLRTGPRSLGAYQGYGGFATYAVAPEEAVLPLPEALSFDQGAVLLGAYETAYHCLIHRGRLKAGESVLIHGASGTTGLAAVHLAKLVGATVLATGRSERKLEEVKKEGADHTIHTVDEEGNLRRFRDEVRELTGGKGVHVVYDGVGGPISVEGLRSVRFGARYLIVGWAATPFVADSKGQRGAPRANQLPTNLILMKSLDVLGCPAAISVHRDPSLRAARLDAILGWAKEGKIHPAVRGVFEMDQVREAMTAKWESRFVGGCVLHP